MRALIDTNIILDFLLEREPFTEDAELLFRAIELRQVIGYVTATTLTDIFYIARRHTKSLDKARQAIAEIMIVMVICPVDREVLEAVLNSNFIDFEDAVQTFSAVTQGLEAIVTRDIQGFRRSPISALSVKELVKELLDHIKK